MSKTCDANGCQRNAFRKCTLHSGRGLRGYVYPVFVNGHSVVVTESLENGELFAYCTNCSTGTGLSVGRVRNISAETRERVKRFMFAVFLESSPCSELSPSGSAQDSNVNINVTPGAGAHSQHVQVHSDNLNAKTSEAIKNNILRKHREHI